MISAATYNGTMAQVAAFFCVDVQTVAVWKSSIHPKTGERKDVELGHWQEGRKVVIGEDDVVDLWVRRHVNAGGLAPGELEAKARRAWRCFRTGRDEAKELAEVRARLARIEEKIFGVAAASVKASGRSGPEAAAALPLQRKEAA
jgi:hypothetical protein